MKQCKPLKVILYTHSDYGDHSSYIHASICPSMSILCMQNFTTNLVIQSSLIELAWHTTFLLPVT